MFVKYKIKNSFGLDAWSYEEFEWEDIKIAAGNISIFTRSPG